MAKLTSIKAGRKRPSVREKVKVQCSCEAEPGDLSNWQFRLTEIEGIVEVECTNCYGELPPYYTPELVEAMIETSVRDALEAAKPTPVAE